MGENSRSQRSVSSPLPRSIRGSKPFGSPDLHFDDPTQPQSRNPYKHHLFPLPFQLLMPTDPAQSLPIVKSEEFLPSISHWMIGGWLLIGITVAGGIALAVCFPQFLPAIDRTHPAVQPDGS